MSKDILRRTSLAAVVAFSALRAVSAPVLADQAPTATPTESQGIGEKQTRIILEKPLIPTDYFTPEVLLLLGGQSLDNFSDSSSHTETTYKNAPKELEDGLIPHGTLEFINAYLKGLELPLEGSDLTWDKISTNTSEQEGVYMTRSIQKSDKLSNIVVPNTFSATSIYQNGQFIENYMEFQIPNANLSQASDEQYFNALSDTLYIPDTYIRPGIAEIQFDQITNPDGTTSGGYVVNYFFILFDEGGFSTLALINEFGKVHVLTTVPETMSTNLEDITST